MLIQEYYFNNTKVKIYDDDIAKDFNTQKEYLDNIIISLIKKVNNNSLL